MQDGRAEGPERELSPLVSKMQWPRVGKGLCVTCSFVTLSKLEVVLSGSVSWAVKGGDSSGSSPCGRERFAGLTVTSEGPARLAHCCPRHLRKTVTERMGFGSRVSWSVPLANTRPLSLGFGMELRPASPCWEVCPQPVPCVTFCPPSVLTHSASPSRTRSTPLGQTPVASSMAEFGWTYEALRGLGLTSCPPSAQAPGAPFLPARWTNVRQTFVSFPVPSAPCARIPHPALRAWAAAPAPGQRLDDVRYFLCCRSCHPAVKSVCRPPGLPEDLRAQAGARPPSAR